MKEQNIPYIFKYLMRFIMHPERWLEGGDTPGPGPGPEPIPERHLEDKDVLQGLFFNTSVEPDFSTLPKEGANYSAQEEGGVVYMHNWAILMAEYTVVKKAETGQSSGESQLVVTHIPEGTQMSETVIAGPNCTALYTYAGSGPIVIWQSESAAETGFFGTTTPGWNTDNFESVQTLFTDVQVTDINNHGVTYLGLFHPELWKNYINCVPFEREDFKVGDQINYVYVNHTYLDNFDPKAFNGQTIDFGTYSLIAQDSNEIIPVVFMGEDSSNVHGLGLTDCGTTTDFAYNLRGSGMSPETLEKIKKAFADSLIYPDDPYFGVQGKGQSSSTSGAIISTRCQVEIMFKIFFLVWGACDPDAVAEMLKQVNTEIESLMPSSVITCEPEAIVKLKRDFTVNYIDNQEVLRPFVAKQPYPCNIIKTPIGLSYVASSSTSNDILLFGANVIKNLKCFAKIICDGTELKTQLTSSRSQGGWKVNIDESDHTIMDNASKIDIVLYEASEVHIDDTTEYVITDNEIGNFQMKPDRSEYAKFFSVNAL